MTLGLARQGARIAGIGRNPEKLAAAAGALAEAGAAYHVEQADATRRADMERAAAGIAAWADSCDILLNCAGVNSQTPFFDVTDGEWQTILDTNVKSVWLSCQIFGRRMVAQRSGSVINISSVASERPLSRVSTYSLSKAAVDNLTKFLAREWGPHGVRVNAIVPGFFPAEQNRRILDAERLANIHAHTPLGRLGRPEELVGTAVWLASEASGFVTGAIVRVDGGFSVTTF
jgi:NAD(P)-dependent dehydrogenase (short-subunit alcohol dehydrogenase family)